MCEKKKQLSLRHVKRKELDSTTKETESRVIILWFLTVSGLLSMPYFRRKFMTVNRV